MKIVTFGDSWGYGSELKPGEIPFGQILANETNSEHLNFSVPGMSLAPIMFNVIRKRAEIHRKDVVLVVIPPDIRWYQLLDNEWHSISMMTESTWSKHAGHFSIEWFIHHHNLFILNIQNTLKTIGCRFLLFHNYGELKFYPEYKALIDKRKFLSDKSLTSLLDSPEWDDNYSKDKKYDGPPMKLSGRFFQGNVNHPNQLGHYKIADLINKHLNLYETV